jgi:hypothetical protein
VKRPELVGYLKIALRVVLAIAGLALIAYEITTFGRPRRGIDSPFWGILLGIGLITVPSIAVRYLVLYVGYIAGLIACILLAVRAWVWLLGTDTASFLAGFVGIGVWVWIISRPFFQRALIFLRLVSPQ